MENGGSALKISYFRTQYYFRRLKFMGFICAKIDRILKILFEIMKACNMLCVYCKRNLFSPLLPPFNSSSFRNKIEINYKQIKNEFKNGIESVYHIIVPEVHMSMVQFHQRDIQLICFISYSFNNNLH